MVDADAHLPALMGADTGPGSRLAIRSIPAA